MQEVVQGGAIATTHAREEASARAPVPLLRAGARPHGIGTTGAEAAATVVSSLEPSGSAAARSSEFARQAAVAAVTWLPCSSVRCMCSRERRRRRGRTEWRRRRTGQTESHTARAYLGLCRTTCYTRTLRCPLDRTDGVDPLTVESSQPDRLQRISFRPGSLRCRVAPCCKLQMDCKRKCGTKVAERGIHAPTGYSRIGIVGLK